QPGIREPRLVAGASLDDVAAQLRLAQRVFQLGREPPGTGPDLLGEAQALEHLQTAEFLLPERSRGRGPRRSSVDRHEASRPSVPDQRAVDLCEPEPLDGQPSRLDDLSLRAEPEDLRRQVLAAPADPLPQVVRMDLKRADLRVPAA